MMNWKDILKEKTNKESIEKEAGAVTTNSVSSISGKLFNITYGGKKHGKKKKDKEEND